MQEQLIVGDIVKSKSGHDKGRYFVVTATLNDRFVLIANGTSRKIDNPKQKNQKHLRKIGNIRFDSNTRVDDDGIASTIQKLLQDIE